MKQKEFLNYIKKKESQNICLSMLYVAENCYVY